METQCADIQKKDIQEIVDNKLLFCHLRESTVLITGATGFIGSTFIKALIAANDRYWLNIQIIGQIRDAEKAKRIFGELFPQITFVKDPYVKCDYIIHTVSPTTSLYFVKHPVETIRASVLSTMEILEVAKEMNARIVYLSSMEQYGIPVKQTKSITEDVIGIINHMNVRSSYSESKRLCECLCVSYAKEYNVDVRIARLAQTFGAGISNDDNHMPMQFARAVIEGKNIVLHTEGNSITNFVYITDAVTGILTILMNGKGGEAYNVCFDRETRSVFEVAEMVASDIAENKIRVEIQKKDDMGYAPDVSMYLNSQKLEHLGWKANVAMFEAYKRLISYLFEKTNI